jgi:hypothetical protein
MMAAAVRAAGHARRGRRRMWVLSFIMLSSALADRVDRQHWHLAYTARAARERCRHRGRGERRAASGEAAGLPPQTFVLAPSGKSVACN